MLCISLVMFFTSLKCDLGNWPQQVVIAMPDFELPFLNMTTRWVTTVSSRNKCLLPIADAG